MAETGVVASGGKGTAWWEVRTPRTKVGGCRVRYEHISLAGVGVYRQKPLSRLGKQGEQGGEARPLLSLPGLSAHLGKGRRPTGHEVWRQASWAAGGGHLWNSEPHTPHPQARGEWQGRAGASQGAAGSAHRPQLARRGADRNTGEPEASL